MKFHQLSELFIQNCTKKKQSTETEKDCLSYLAKFNLSRLTENERVLCEGKLTKRECWEALVSIGNNKSPGNDGFTKEFYACFFDEIHRYLIESLNSSFNSGKLSNSQRQFLITLIEKKGKDERHLQNWRPISLMNVDAKLASKSLALRVRKVLTSLIQADQTAYVKDRYIGESVKLINDMLECADKNKILNNTVFS